jgi:hypothetical protein
VDVKTGESTRLTGPDEFDGGGRLSPDGKTLLFQRLVNRKLPELIEPLAEPFGYVRPLRFTDQFTVTVGEPDSAKPLPNQWPAADGGYLAQCWSPDGKWVAYLFCAGRYEVKEMRLVIATPDGAHRKVILTEKVKASEAAVDFLDWR